MSAASSSPHSEAEPSEVSAKRLRKSERKEQRRAHAKEQRQQRKKAQKLRKQEQRKARLEAMTAEERAEFLERERQAGRDRKAAADAALESAFQGGRPRIVVNCSFSASLAPKELTSLAKQLQLAYSQARELRSRCQLHLASLGPGNLARRPLELQGLASWKLHVHEGAVWEVFAEEARQDQLVILSPDAEEDLLEVLEEEVYVVGGIVDRSVKKMQSLAQAREMGLARYLLTNKGFGWSARLLVFPPHAMSASALVEIYLASLSGSSCAVTISPDTPLHLLKLEAQKHLRLCRGVVRLAFGGRLLDLSCTLSEAGLRDGATVHAIVQRVNLASIPKGFALYTENSVVTWGEVGRRSGQVGDQLVQVQEIQANMEAFAAILQDGSVVTWGEPGGGRGGDSRLVREQLVRVRRSKQLNMLLLPSCTTALW
ncbi:unnamed protein product [Effrenium voratum]|nr:unnamed protein product [Effrenium voratum]